uniref:Uncharacterized protein n=1 Tax=Anopheles atroparvus TaxID=41427 RepID=A0AAG5DP83_ANOAO
MTPKIFNIRRLNISGALFNPNGTRVQQNRPKEVMNVVKFELSRSSSICQNPLLKSSTVKTRLPASRLNRYSCVGINKKQP